MTFNVNSLLCRQFYAYYDQTAEAKIMRFLLCTLKCSTISRISTYYVFTLTTKENLFEFQA